MGSFLRQALLADSSKKTAQIKISPPTSSLGLATSFTTRCGLGRARLVCPTTMESSVRPMWYSARATVPTHAFVHYLLRTPAFAIEAERWSYGITSDMWSLRPEHFKLI